MVDVRSTIEESNASFAQAVRSQDLSRIGEFYTSDAVLLLGNMPPSRGCEEIKQFFQGAFALGLTELTFDTKDVRALGDVAVEEGNYRMIMGGDEQRGRYVVVHQGDRDGSWRALYDIVQPQ